MISFESRIAIPVEPCGVPPPGSLLLGKERVLFGNVVQGLVEAMLRRCHSRILFSRPIPEEPECQYLARYFGIALSEKLEITGRCCSVSPRPSVIYHIYASHTLPVSRSRPRLIASFCAALRLFVTINSSSHAALSSSFFKSFSDGMSASWIISASYTWGDFC